MSKRKRYLGKKCEYPCPCCKKPWSLSFKKPPIVGNLVMNVICPNCKSQMILKVSLIRHSNQSLINHIIIKDLSPKEIKMVNPYDQADQFV
jgi:hypothetical protein